MSLKIKSFVHDIPYKYARFSSSQYTLCTKHMYPYMHITSLTKFTTVKVVIYAWRKFTLVTQLA